MYNKKGERERECFINVHVCFKYTGTVRLAGVGSSDREGRLEVYHDGRWGTVCDDYFNHVAAKVACNSLGFG